MPGPVPPPVGGEPDLRSVGAVADRAPLQPLRDTTTNPVARAAIRNLWCDLTFLHWPVDPAQVTRRLPPGLRPDVHDGRAWVSLVPFEMRGNRVPGTPPLPGISRFAETNVRTYVVDPEGHRAVWFDSLDATSLPVVALARIVLGFPYVWSRMTSHRDGDRLTYVTASRRWPRSPATSTVVVDAGAPVEADDLDRFLTARWSTVTWHRGRLWRSEVDHPAWPLRDGTVVHLDDGLVAAAGYEVTGPPRVRVVDAVPARFRWRRPVDVDGTTPD